jgi:gamma-glutamyltranspeptidase/glutathione hydrolase
MLIYLANERRVITIDHRETAPAAFTSEIFREHGVELAFDEAVRSGLSVGVPGTVRGWELALDRYGTMRFAQVLQPAIDVAQRGFTVRPQFSRFIAYNQTKFAAFPQTAALYLHDGKPLATGTPFRNADLAGAYSAIARGGARAFYEGPIAEAIVKIVDDPTVVTGTTNVRKGVLTRADLSNYEARLRLPVRSTYRGYEIYGCHCRRAARSRSPRRSISSRATSCIGCHAPMRSTCTSRRRGSRLRTVMRISRTPSSSMRPCRGC